MCLRADLVRLLPAYTVKRDVCSQVLTWSAYSVQDFGVDRVAQTQTATFDPGAPPADSVTAFTVTNTNHDMFCPGITMLGSGAIVVTGGDNAEKTSIYDVDADAWMPGPDLNIARGYQASCLTSDGKVRHPRNASRSSHTQRSAQSGWPCLFVQS